MNEKNDQVFQFKITLDNSAPRIWRRLLIAKDASFFDLHVAIQDVMGWFDSHLHGFSISSKDRNIAPIIIQFPNPEFGDDFAMRDVRDERLEKILNYFGVSIRQCKYEYDFGDGWKHLIKLEDVLFNPEQLPSPQCADGARHCPPEDCGGVTGYAELRRTIKNPRHRDYKETMLWLGGHFDPDYFSVDQVNKELLNRCKLRYPR